MSEPSDTPRTEEVMRGPGGGSFFRMVDHARELERENTALRAELDIHREADVEIKAILKRFQDHAK